MHACALHQWQPPFVSENPCAQTQHLTQSPAVAGLCLVVIAAPAAAAWNGICKGTATYTSSGYSGGAALLDPIPPKMMIAALNPKQMNYGGVAAALAGAYLQVRGPLGIATLYVTDLYPEGRNCGLDLSPNAFAAIGDIRAGHIPIRWKVVAAPMTGNVVYRIKEGSSQPWAAIQVGRPSRCAITCIRWSSSSTKRTASGSVCRRGPTTISSARRWTRNCWRSASPTFAARS
ncbi:extracellular endoglucanase (expansin) [Xanthomonas translucens DAR61454]|nr:extracellular endoglucanase (expansin) [Xanthomonas translucens DAR61454]